MFRMDPGSGDSGGYVVVALRGELDLMDAAAVAAALRAVAARQPRIIADLAGLEFIDSSGVAALAHGRRQARQAGGNLTLAAPQRKVLEVLAITRLAEAFSIYATAEEAASGAGRPLAPAVPAPRRSGKARWLRAVTRSRARGPRSVAP